MSELLLQAIIEKLEAIELLLKVTDTGKEKENAGAEIKQELESLRKEVKNLPSQLLLGTVKLGELSFNVNRLNEQLQKPVSSQIEHKHELHKGFWIAVSLFVICFLLTWGWLTTYKTAELSAANDIKYRALKFSGNEWLLKYCNYTDSLYQKDGAGFRDKVEQEESRLIERAELIRLAVEKEREAKTLKDRAGRR